MKKTISLVLVLALGLAVEVSNADFTFGEPTNLGPTINGLYHDAGPSLSADGLDLYFYSNRPGGYGGYDIWVSTRQSTNDTWGPPTNLGPTVNSPYNECYPSLSSDGLTLYFSDYYSGSTRPGGLGGADIWMTTRVSHNDPWTIPVNVGAPINNSNIDISPTISGDGLTLVFTSNNRAGGIGSWDLWISTRGGLQDPWSPHANLGKTVNAGTWDGECGLSWDCRALFFDSGRAGIAGAVDLWMSIRKTLADSWAVAVNLGPVVNSSGNDGTPRLSPDMRTLYFCSDRSGGFGSYDLLEAPIVPVVDFNGDGIVDAADVCIMIDNWHTDNPLCDIGPAPWGDGVVDVQDLIVLAEHLFEGIPPVESEEVNVDEGDDSSQVELEQGQILVVTLESNPTTGYSWEVIETQESILQQMGEAEYKPSETGEPPLVGAGGWEIFRFKAVSAGQMTLKLGYRRPWEEGVEPVNTFSIHVVVN